MIVAKGFKINSHRPKPFLGYMITTLLFLKDSLVIWQVNHLDMVIEDLRCDDLILLGGLTQKGKGTSVDAGSPWLDPSSPFTYIVYNNNHMDSTFDHGLVSKGILFTQGPGPW